MDTECGEKIFGATRIKSPRHRRMLVEIWFLENGYRNAAPFGAVYRSHLVVKDTDEYLGVEFERFEKPAFGEHIVCDIKFLYEKVDYSRLRQGVSFDIMEGPHVVGEGFVI